MAVILADWVDRTGTTGLIAVLLVVLRCRRGGAGGGGCGGCGATRGGKSWGSDSPGLTEVWVGVILLTSLLGDDVVAGALNVPLLTGRMIG